ncbi:MAG TPA: hypothetical protein VGJ05_19995 [Fimbriiglobus sp.]|jgi:hypothetical protein
MQRFMLPVIVVFAAGGVGGWLSSQYLLPQLQAQQPPTPAQAPAPKPGEPAKPGAEEEHPLDTLDWLVGDWSATGEKQTVDFSCHFAKNHSFLVRSFRMLEGNTVKMSGMQIVGWDESLHTIRSWTYDSDGGFGHEIWSQVGNRYTLRSSYTLPSGIKGSSINTLTFIDKNHFAWKSVDREIDGELQPDVDEFTVSRTSPPEELKAEQSKKEGK